MPFPVKARSISQRSIIPDVSLNSNRRDYIPKHLPNFPPPHTYSKKRQHHQIYDKDTTAENNRDETTFGGSIECVNIGQSINQNIASINQLL